ncbi:hypothetical protein [Rhizobium miluonense]|nr:hypothetical protein [Rhizobium miluonense]
MKKDTRVDDGGEKRLDTGAMEQLGILASVRPRSSVALRLL